MCGTVFQAGFSASLRNRLPNDSLVSGRPPSPAMNVRSPHGPASSVFTSIGRIGRVTTVLVFSVLMTADATAHMLPTERRHHRDETGVDGIEPDALSCANRPASFVGRDSSSIQAINPSEFGAEGLAMPAVGSVLSTPPLPPSGTDRA